MSNKNYSNHKNTRYFFAFFNKGFIFPAIFFAFVFTTILALVFEYDFFAQIPTANNKTFAIIVATYFFALLLIYAFSSIRKENITMGDSICASFLFTAIFYLIYLLASGIDKIDLVNIAIVIVLLVVGIVLSLLKSTSYDQVKSTKETIVNKRNIKSYFKVINKEFGFIKLFFTSIIIFSIFYLALDLKYDVVALLQTNGIDSANYFFNVIKDIVINNYFYLALVSVGVVAILLYSFISAVNNETNSLDMFLSAYYITIPVIGAMFYLMGNFDSLVSLIILGGVTLFVIVLTILRVIFLNRYKIIGVRKSTFCKKLILNKDTFKAIGLTAMIVAFSNITFELGILKDCLIKEQTTFYIGLIPYYLICVACIYGVISFGIEMVKSLFNLASNKLEVCDRYIIYNFMFALFFLAYELVMPIINSAMSFNILNICIAASYLLISFGTFLMRNHSAKQ